MKCPSDECNPDQGKGRTEAPVKKEDDKDGGRRRKKMYPTTEIAEKMEQTEYLMKKVREDLVRLETQFNSQNQLRMHVWEGDPL